MMERSARFLCLLAVTLLTCGKVSTQYEHYLDNLSANELYEYTDGFGSIQYLQRGDSEYALLHLENPIYFYGEKYDQLFINTNGILTFNIEFGEYLNQPFPLEYPSIAPFYSNVDTSEVHTGTSISIFETHDPTALQRAQRLVRYAYSDQSNFETTRLIVGTWRDVGYFDSKTDRLNTFQVVLILNENNTFVQFIYPSGGLNWLQGEAGSLGLPDVRAQAGFVAEDGRFYSLHGSGSENVRFLSENTNFGMPGVWLFRVGPLAYNENVQLPDNKETRTDSPALASTCSEVSHKCHSNARCSERSDGFCCVCTPGYYGNGYICIKNDYPIRVTGSISGEINGQTIDERAKLQSYVVVSDARSYTAVNPVSAELGAKLRLVLPLVANIGWLFAKPLKGALNGYQLTGGDYVHTSRIRYDSGEVLIVNQTFEGLNYWDQLSVKTYLFGEVPHLRHSTKLNLADYIDEYRFVSTNEISSVHSHTFEIPEENRVINFKVEQTIAFQQCLLDEDPDPTDTVVLQKVSKLVLEYFERDQALRTSALNKIGVDAETNACTDGSYQCGEKQVCVPYEDTYKCDCLYGYSMELDENRIEICVDIDECAQGTHVCDENAMCINQEGGFTCVCLDGFLGNGYRCLRNSSSSNISVDNFEYPTKPTYETFHQEETEEDSSPYGSQQKHLDECQRCSSDANCFESRCVCRDGFSGDGYSCSHICGHDEAWENGRCVPILFDDHEFEPHCNFLGECSCADGYELSEETRMCHYIGHYDVDKSEDLVPCDVDSNCHINATCAWFEHELRHICTCNPGLRGDGFNCELIDDSCAIKPEICDSHASCQYNDQIGKSECQCERGYEGDGFRCQLAPECQGDADCGEGAFCDSGVCQCNSDFERDVNDVCVPVGRCGAVFCGANALCKWDSVQSVQYCDCMTGYDGDALEGCKSIPSPCNVRNNCGIHATCEPTEDPAHYECQCNAGYHGDGYVCFEDHNCLNNPTLCDMNAKCLSTNTGLVCVCNQGFYGNGSICLERRQHDSGFLIVSQGVVIVRVPLNGRNALPISVASMAIGLDKDCVEGRVYWGDISAKKIVSAKFDGTEARAFITEDIESPEGIAIDVISRRIYWTDSVKDTIEVASLDDSRLRAVIINKNLVNPRGIAVDPHKEKLYWSDWDRDSPKIEMSDLDGTGRELLLGKDSVALPNSLVVLSNTGELCYADAGNKKVECIDSYSRKIRTISTDLSYPFGLTYTQDQFLWTDWSSKKLESIDSFGTRKKPIQTPFFGSHKMYGMTAVEEHCPQTESPCHVHNGGCMDGRLCLVNRKSPSGKSCKCTSLSKTCSLQ